MGNGTTMVPFLQFQEEPGYNLHISLHQIIDSNVKKFGYNEHLFTTSTCFSHLSARCIFSILMQNETKGFIFL